MATGIGVSFSFLLSLCPDHYSGKVQPWCAAASRAGLIAHNLGVAEKHQFHEI
jgi:hypothetical protein